MILLLRNELQDEEGKLLLEHIKNCETCTVEYTLLKTMPSGDSIFNDDDEAEQGCPDPETMRLLMEDKLEEQRRDVVLTHIMSCTDCSMEYALLKAMAKEDDDVLGKELAEPACLTDEAISRWLGGQLDDAERKTTLFHLADCNDCAGRVSAVYAKIAAVARHK